MDYFCEVCEKYIRPKSECKHFKSVTHKEIDECKHLLLSHKDIDIKELDEAIHLYFIEHNKESDYYLIKCQFESIFNDFEYCPYITCKLSDKKTMIS